MYLFIYLLLFYKLKKKKIKNHIIKITCSKSLLSKKL